MFKIYYYHNPITYFPSKWIQKSGNRLVSLGLIKLKEQREVRNFHGNPSSFAIQAIDGLSKIYAFKEHYFLHQNLSIGIDKWTHKKTFKYRKRVCGRKTWLKIFYKLRNQLDAIRHFKSCYDLMQSRFAPYIILPNNYQEEIAPKKTGASSKSLGNFDFNHPYRFSGKVYQVGLTKYGIRPTLLLKNLTYHGKVVASHLWLDYTPALLKLGQLIQGTKITFDANVIKYINNDYTKYGLINIHNAKSSANFHISLPKTPKAIIGYILAMRGIESIKDKTNPFYLDVKAYHAWQKA